MVPECSLHELGGFANRSCGHGIDVLWRIDVHGLISSNERTQLIREFGSQSRYPPVLSCLEDCEREAVFVCFGSADVNICVDLSGFVAQIT